MELEKVKAVMVGHAVGDALGVPVEFCSREMLDADPVTDMRGSGSHDVPKGTWSDDTSMSLCALEAMGGQKINIDRVMRNFVKWLDEGEFTATGKTFDVGNTCCGAICEYKRGTEWKRCGASSDNSNGNGSLMRIQPFAMFVADKIIPVERKISVVEIGSVLTHAHTRSRIACGIYAFVLWEILADQSKTAVRRGLEKAKRFYEEKGKTKPGYATELRYYSRLFSDNFDKTDRRKIMSGGYVVETLEAAIWCLLTTDNYRDCVLASVNLGHDTDTVGAVTGGLAGAMYGYEGIPQSWRETLLRRDYIEELCERASFAEK